MGRGLVDIERQRTDRPLDAVMVEVSKRRGYTARPHNVGGCKETRFGYKACEYCLYCEHRGKGRWYCIKAATEREKKIKGFKRKGFATGYDTYCNLFEPTKTPYVYCVRCKRYIEQKRTYVSEDGQVRCHFCNGEWIRELAEKESQARYDKMVERMNNGEIAGVERRCEYWMDSNDIRHPYIASDWVEIPLPQKGVLCAGE